MPPRKREINPEEVQKLCMLHCSKQEICDWFGISLDTIERRVKEWEDCVFEDYWRRYAATGKISVRHKAKQLADSGHWKAIEHFLEHWCGHVSKSEVAFTNMTQPVFVVENEELKPQLAEPPPIGLNETETNNSSETPGEILNEQK